MQPLPAQPHALLLDCAQQHVADAAHSSSGWA